MVSETILTWNRQRGVTNLKKVLIIDDSALVLRNLKALLSEKYEVMIATNGEMGLQKASEKKPDIILLDYEMPGMNGKETYERLASKPVTSNIPVIFLTSVSDGKKVLEILEMHPAGYVLKPPSGDKLIEKIEEVLSEY